jgi:hypothetical protein
MTETELNELLIKIASDVIEVYGLYCDHIPKVFVITGIASALASCASASSIGRDLVIAVLNSAFDDIERGEPAPDERGREP